jgi:hypothetical protein
VRRNVAYDISRHRRLCEKSEPDGRAAKRSRSCRKPASQKNAWDLTSVMMSLLRAALAVLSNALRRGERCFSPPGSVRRREILCEVRVCALLLPRSALALWLWPSLREKIKSRTTLLEYWAHGVARQQGPTPAAGLDWPALHRNGRRTGEQSTGGHPARHATRA